MMKAAGALKGFSRFMDSCLRGNDGVCGNGCGNRRWNGCWNNCWNENPFSFLSSGGIPIPHRNEKGFSFQPMSSFRRMSFSWRRYSFWHICLLLLLGILWTACGGTPDTGEDPEVTTRGTVEVTAELTEIRGDFIDRADYDYAFVMKYKVLEVHRGKVDQDFIYVGHYNPQKPRDRVADARVTDVGGRLQKFRAGDIHRLALETPIDDFFMGGIVNRYFEEYSGPVYWAVWTNLVTR